MTTTIDPTPPDRHPALTLKDVCIAAIVARRREVGLAAVAGDFEYMMRDRLNFEDVSYGLPRLLAAGLVDLRRDADGVLVLQATSRATTLYHQDEGVIDAVFLLADDLSITMEPDEPEDRSLGQLPGLSEETVAEVLSPRIAPPIAQDGVDAG